MLRLVLAAWLAAWWCCTGLVMGLLANAWISRLSGGRWGAPLQALVPAVARRLPWLLLAGLPVLLGLRALYPWATDPAWAHDLTQPAFAQAWLKPVPWAVRLLLCTAVWAMLARPRWLARKGATAAALVLYTLAGSVLAVDLLMSLMPGWRSTAFGLVVLSSQALGGAALAVLLLAWLQPARLGARHEGTPLGRDLGNLLLMWVMTWAYLAFMQFVVIWAEDLPAETVWYLPRLHGAGGVAAIALVLLKFALPQLALLWRHLKDTPRTLGALAALLLATQVLDSAWLVLPSVGGLSPWAWLLVPLFALLLGWLAFARVPQAVRRWHGDPPQPFDPAPHGAVEGAPHG